jgi:predicted transcriptional regulator of viral defense system
MPDAVDLSLDNRPKGRPRGFDEAIAALAGAQYGVVSHPQLAALGLAPRAIQYRLTHGRLHRLHRGVYAVGHDALRREGAWMAATLVADGAVLSHRSAAALWGIRGDDRARTEITGRAR